MELTRVPVPQALDRDGLHRLESSLAAARGAVALCGSPGVFCTGMQLGSDAPRPEAAGTALRRFGQLLDAVLAFEGPVLALVDGPALGGGLGLAAAADVVLCTQRARFGLPEVMVGLVPGVVLPFVARRMGPSRARMLAMGEPSLDAQAALAAGLADEVCEDLEAALAARMRRFARLDAAAVASAKALSRKLGSLEYRDEAIARFCEQLGLPETRRRLERQAAGETPWE